MEMKDVEMMKTKFEIGDVVVIPMELAGLTHERKEAMVAEVVGKYRHFFNIKYKIVKHDYKDKYVVDVNDVIGTFVLINGSPEVFEDSTFEQSILWKDANKVKNISALVSISKTA